MSFAAPLALFGLVAVPVLALLYLALERRRRREAGAFARAELQPNMVKARPGWRRHVPAALLLGGLGLMVLAVARPHLDRTVERPDATIVLALDVSRSMVADDVQPTRLDAARSAISDLLDTVPETYRIGVIAFSTSAEPILAPTRDREAVRVALSEVRLGTGTAIGEAVLRSIELAQASTGADAAVAGDDVAPAAVLLLSDGAQTAGGATPAQAAAEAVRAKIPISTVALGTTDATVEVPMPNGVVEQVSVPPDPDTLKKLAEQTNGTFFQAIDAEGLRAVYADLGTRLAREEIRTEVSSAFAGLGALTLLASSALSLRWFRRAI